MAYVRTVWQTEDIVTADALNNIEEELVYLDTCIPPHPVEDGTYQLKVTVSEGTPTYSWEATT